MKKRIPNTLMDVAAVAAAGVVVVGLYVVVIPAAIAASPVVWACSKLFEWDARREAKKKNN